MDQEKKTATPEEELMTEETAEAAAEEKTPEDKKAKKKKSKEAEALERCEKTHTTDWAAIKGEIKNDLSGYLFKTTKRNPMILPIIEEVSE